MKTAENLTQNGHMYTCGQGQGGRLGTGFEDHLIEPRLVATDVEMVSAAPDHSAVVTSKGQVIIKFIFLKFIYFQIKLINFQFIK